MVGRSVGIVILILPGLGLCACKPPASSSTPTPTVQQAGEGLEETDTDQLGLYASSPNYRTVMDAGARVVNLSEPATFFVLWVPEDYADRAARRVLVAAHGSRGTAYAEIDQELEFADQYGYALVAVQWWLPQSDQYLEPDVVHEIITVALDYMQSRYGTDVHKAAYTGFSRGSAISYEVTFYDRQTGTEYFALTISHSGGVPLTGGRPFFAELEAGAYGAEPFAGTHFFMYCGMQDEYWGTEQCAQMHNAEQIVSGYGATIDQFIEDPDGGHTGFRDNPEYHEQAILRFIELTAD